MRTELDCTNRNAKVVVTNSFGEDEVLGYVWIQKVVEDKQMFNNDHINGVKMLDISLRTNGQYDAATLIR